MAKKKGGKKKGGKKKKAVPAVEEDQVQSGVLGDCYFVGLWLICLWLTAVLSILLFRSASPQGPAEDVVIDDNAYITLNLKVSLRGGEVGENPRAMQDSAT